MPVTSTMRKKLFTRQHQEWMSQHQILKEANQTNVLLFFLTKGIGLKSFQITSSNWEENNWSNYSKRGKRIQYIKNRI